VLDIGEGALRRLQAARMNAWAAPAAISGREALELFAQGKLSPVPAAHSAAQEAHGGCCCGAHGTAGLSSCCASTEQN